MEFGLVALEQAEGAVLAHSVPLSKGRLRKGIRLNADHIALLRDAGLGQVTVARLAPDDVHEDEAAERLANALVPEPEKAGLRIGPAATGRVNLFALHPGIAEVDAEKINALNTVDAMITVATVPQWQRMSEGGMVATVKIISYAVAETNLETACRGGRDALSMRTPRFGSATLIQTSNSGDDGEKGQAALKTRLDRLNVELAPKTVVAHDVGPLKCAVQAAQGEILFILTGSATSDLRDTAPEALLAAGGTVHHFGMPVDPGNLLFLGELDGKPVIGLPGCARSPALNGADWVMERVICGVPVRSAEIMAMGVGGLLKEIPSRPRPREG